jgi:hypothetical protein
VDSRVGFRVEDNLGQSPSIAQVDEDQPAMVSSAMNPAGQRHLFGRVFGSEFSACMRFVHCHLSFLNPSIKLVSTLGVIDWNLIR